jgi:3-hydroxy-3-methylglutaryl CoA synthase
MVGIISQGAYIPLWRLRRDAIVKGLRGEKAIANFDEDSLTMAVAAVNDCLNGINRQEIDGLFFASTTYPYKEKLGATTIAAAADLRRDIFTADFSNSLRAGTTALKSAMDAINAGSAKRVVVVAADCRLGNPGSANEQNFGDGAAAFLIGDSAIAANLEASYSISNEMMDTWRVDTDSFVRTWEERFCVTEGYLKIVPEAVSGLLKKVNLSPKDFNKVVFYAHDPRRLGELARGLGFDPKTQVQDSLFDVMGNTGTAYPLMLLVSTLEEAKPGDRILLASYGNGSDAFVLRATEQIDKIKDGRRGMKGYLPSKATIDDYRTYLKWRGLLKWETMRRYGIGIVSRTALWREREQIYPFYGTKCKVCGNIQYPPTRVCVNCAAKDQFENFRLSDKKAKIFSYSMDYLTSDVDVPLVMATIDFEEGARFFTPLTDKIPEELKVGMSVEMTFRKLFSTEDMHQYYWKAMPLRT